jgi:hypothetical protein
MPAPELPAPHHRPAEGKSAPREWRRHHLTSSNTGQVLIGQVLAWTPVWTPEPAPARTLAWTPGRCVGLPGPSTAPRRGRAGGP